MAEWIKGVNDKRTGPPVKTSKVRKTPAEIIGRIQDFLDTADGETLAELYKTCFGNVKSCEYHSTMVGEVSEWFEVEIERGDLD